MAVLTVKKNGTAQYTTLAAATSDAADGDIVEIQDSETYNEAINLTSYNPPGGGFLKVVHYRAAEGVSPTWDGTGFPTAPCLNASTVKPGHVNGTIELTGIRFTNWNNGNDSSSAGAGIFWANGRTRFRIRRCTFEDCTAITLNYVYGTAGNPSLFQRCLWKNTGRTAFRIGDTTVANAHVRFENCVIEPSSGRVAIELDYSTTTAFHVTVYCRNGTGVGGILAGTVQNCIVVNAPNNFGGTGLKGNVLVSHSCVHGTWGTPIAGTQGSGILQQDPLFTNAGASDFTLREGSPCVDTGTDVSITEDFVGNPRPDGAGYDMGAYELQSSADIATITATGPTSIRVTFTGPVTETSSLLNPDNYTITQNLPADGVNLVVSQVVPEPGGEPTYVDLVTNEQTSGQSYNLALSNIDFVNDGNGSFVGQGDPPNMGVVVLDVNHLRVNFTEPMYNADESITDPTNYLVTGPQIEGYSFEVLTVEPDDPNEPTYVILELNFGLIGGQTYELEVQSFKDLALNPIDPSSTFFQGPNAVVVGAMLLETDVLRIDFFGPITPSESLADPANYVITRRSPQFGTVPGVLEVDFDDQEWPQYVYLLTEPHTNTQNYRISFSGVDALTDGYADYVGVGEEIVAGIMGAFFTSEAKVYVSSDGLPVSDPEKVWEEAHHTTFLSDTELGVILPEKAPGTVVDVRISVGRRETKKRGFFSYPEE